MTAFPEDDARAAAWLRTPEAVRIRAHQLLSLAEDGRLDHFAVDLDRLDIVADYVAAVVRENYPDLRIPYHARWRHFSVGALDRWRSLSEEVLYLADDEIARIRFDLCVPSVLLDAGAGGDWIFEEPGSGLRFSRSEGLALASFYAFRNGMLSSDPERLLRSEASALAGITAREIEQAFQVRPDNPLIGVEGRAMLMQKLGRALRARPDLFGRDEPRIGNLYDALRRDMREGSLPARTIFSAVLDGFGPIWPSRLALAGVNLGDVWRHSAIATEDAEGLVPFHKLSQWLTYSLVEIFEDAGIRVTGLNDLTGLPEYRNGGLFVDLGVLVPRDPEMARRRLPVDDEAIVEWRALTVALLDRIADPVRQKLGRGPADLPLARILEGGTWAAGRKIARQLRPDGSPPLQVLSDGTVF